MEVLTGLTPDSSPQKAPTPEPCEVEDGLRLALDAGCNQRYTPDLEGLHCESRGHFAHRGCHCRLCDDGCDAHRWSDGYDVWYWSLVGYIMYMNSISSRGVFSPAVWLRLSWMVRSRRPSSCAFSCIHCFAFISRDVAFRLRGRFHEFLVARLLSCRCLDLSPSLRTCRLRWLGYWKKLKNNAFIGYSEHFLFTRSTFLVQRLG